MPLRTLPELHFPKTSIPGRLAASFFRELRFQVGNVQVAHHGLVVDQDCPFEKRFPSQLVRDDVFYMSLAYNQAIDAWRGDEVPIGAIIVVGGEVVGAAHNAVEGSKDPTAHAEILAITQAAGKLGDWRLEGATVYVTKEPCPMCSGAMLMSRVARVCYAVPDPKMGCLGGATNLNDLPRVNHHCEITAGGVLEGECRQVLQEFFRTKRNEGPGTGD